MPSYKVVLYLVAAVDTSVAVDILGKSLAEHLVAGTKLLNGLGDVFLQY